MKYNITKNNKEHIYTTQPLWPLFSFIYLRFDCLCKKKENKIKSDEKYI